MDGVMKYIMEFSHLCVCVNSTINFAIYSLRGEKFKAAWRETYLRCGREENKKGGGGGGNARGNVRGRGGGGGDLRRGEESGEGVTGGRSGGQQGQYSSWLCSCLILVMSVNKKWPHCMREVR